MRILHVSLGNPYTHEGGLNRYCIDLIKAQEKEGADTYVLYPGSYKVGNRAIKIRHRGRCIYRIDGALPVPITYGIDKPVRYMINGDVNAYESFLRKLCPDIVHVHSFMGIHKEFFCACKNLSIKIIFTTHDCFPFCFKCNLIDYNDELCKTDFDAEKCARCNAGCGLSAWTQRLMQLDIYQAIKNNDLVKKIKKISHSASSEIAEETHYSLDPEAYRELREFYNDIMEMVDVVHCNSKVSEGLYRRALPMLKYVVVPITHYGIRKDKHTRNLGKPLQISYFGGASKHKGYLQLKELISLLPKDESWEMNLYGGMFPDEITDRHVHIKGYFTKEEEASVWEDTDLLLFISQCPESFGFSVLEALALGIPVICSDLAGASVLLDDIEQCIYKHDDVNELLGKVCWFFDEDNYSNIQKKIGLLPIDIDMEKHERKIQRLYEEVLRK